MVFIFSLVSRARLCVSQTCSFNWKWSPMLWVVPHTEFDNNTEESFTHVPHWENWICCQCNWAPTTNILHIIVLWNHQGTVPIPCNKVKKLVLKQTRCHIFFFFFLHHPENIYVHSFPLYLLEMWPSNRIYSRCGEGMIEPCLLVTFTWCIATER